MQNYCVHCGGKLLPGAGFCAGCGTPVPPQAACVRPQAGVICPLCGTENIGVMKFCRTCRTPLNAAGQSGGLGGMPLYNGTITADRCKTCGAPMKTTAKFCEVCGAALAAFPPPAAAPRQFYTTPAFPPPSPPSRRYSLAFRVTALALCGILFCTAVFSSLILRQWGGGPDSAGPVGYAAPPAQTSQSATVSAENSRVSLAGVIIEANPLNLMDGSESVTVTRYTPQQEEDGLQSELYDISLGNQKQLLAPLRVTIPFAADKADGGAVALLHYEEALGIWSPLNCETDAAGGTVSAKLTGLSPVKLVYLGRNYPSSLYYIRDSQTADATIELNYNYWSLLKSMSLEPAVRTAQDYLDNGNIAASTAWQKSGALSQGVDTAAGYAGVLGPLAESSIAVNASTAGPSDALSFASDQLERGVNTVSFMLMGAQLASDIASKGVNASETSVNFYKNVLSNSNNLYSALNGAGSAALSISFLGVTAVGLGLDYAVEYAGELQKDTVKTIFDQYYTQMGGTFNEQEWYKTFVEAYYRAWQDSAPDALDRAIGQIGGEIERQAESFWQDVYRDGSDAMTFTIAEAGRRNYFTPQVQHRELLTQACKADMVFRFNAYVLPWINDFLLAEMQRVTAAQLRDAVSPLNERYTVQIQEIAPAQSAAVCKYQGHDIRFYTGEQRAQGDWLSLVSPENDDEWAVETSFTLLSYLESGAPDSIKLFPGGSTGSPDHQVPFTLKRENNSTFNLVDLSGETVIAGIYTGVQSYDDYQDFAGSYGTDFAYIPKDVTITVHEDGTAAMETSFESSYSYSDYGAQMHATGFGALSETGILFTPDGNGGYTAAFETQGETFSGGSYGGEAYGGESGSLDSTGAARYIVTMTLALDEYGGPYITGVIECFSLGRDGAPLTSVAVVVRFTCVRAE